ncbi:MAG: dTDP-4-dehydrorhamnose reductase [Sphingomonadales bacterium]|nr:dTDP-4-dehydrorhamnose reductase [Sphingomonadales bacterium]
MKALIFGGAGQLGRALQDCAGERWQFDAVDLPECDIGDEAAVQARIARSDADIIINAAAYTAVDKAESEPELAQRINGDAPGYMARAAAEAGKGFVHISTDFVFGDGYDAPIAPDAVPSPLSVYGATKWAGERNVQAAMPDALIIRTSWVYAAAGANFVLTMLRLMKERSELSVVADQMGSPTLARDLAGAVLALAQAKAAGLYHYTNEGVCSWHEFAVAIGEEALAAGLLDTMPVIHPIPTTGYPTPARRPAYSVLDKAATWEKLGEPARHWRGALHETILEIQNNG